MNIVNVTAFNRARRTTLEDNNVNTRLQNKPEKKIENKPEKKMVKPTIKTKKEKGE